MSINNNIINRVINETSSKEEARDVVDWFSSTIEGQQYLSDMLDKDAYQMENDFNTGKSFSLRQSERLLRKIDKEISTKRIRRITLRVAAVLLPFILLTGIFVYFESGGAPLFKEVTYTELFIPKGENARIFFQDGTEVFINSDTRIRYPERFGLRNRKVYLDGEAYFTVASNKRKPFTVYAHKFNVKAYSESETIEVVLDEGKTTFQVNNNIYPMAPGQQIEYNKTTDRSTLYNLSRSSNKSLWKKNIIYFHDTPLSDVMKVLERKYDVQFHLQSPEALNYSYTITTKQNNIESVLNELQKISPVKFIYDENKIFVSI